MSDNINNISAGTTQTQNYKPLSGWVSFVAIMTIIYGAFLCLGIISAIVGIPIIISGVKFLNAAGNFKKLKDSSDINNYNSAIDDLNTYFIINGILTIVGLVIMLLYIIVLIALVGSGAFHGLKDNLRL